MVFVRQGASKPRRNTRGLGKGEAEAEDGCFQQHHDAPSAGPVEITI